MAPLGTILSPSEVYSRRAIKPIRPTIFASDKVPLYGIRVKGAVRSLGEVESREEQKRLLLVINRIPYYAFHFLAL
jgi:hypothetical protein